jgi:hypothetical protein
VGSKYPPRHFSRVKLVITTTGIASGYVLWQGWYEFSFLTISLRAPVCFPQISSYSIYLQFIYSKSTLRTIMILLPCSSILRIYAHL